MSKITTNTTLIISLFLAVVMSSVTYAKADKKDLPKETKDGLVLKEDAEVDIAYIRPNVDWNKFKTVYFRTLIVSDEAKDATPDKPGSRRGHLGESWIIPEKDIVLMQEEFARIMTEEMVDEGFTVVDEPQAGTLVVAAEVVDIYLTAPIEKSRRSYGSSGAIYTEGGGSITIAAALADAEDNRILAYIADNRYPSQMWHKNTRVSNIADMKSLFRVWGSKLANGLNSVKTE